MESIIKRIERIFSFDLSYLISGGQWLLITRAMNIGISFFLALAYAHFLSKDLYGTYRYIVNILSLLGFLALPGMGTAMVYAVARGHEGSFRKATIVETLSSLSFLIVGVVGFFWFKHSGNMVIAWAFLLGSVLSILAEPSNNYLGYYNAKKEFKIRTKFSMATGIAYGIIMLATVLTIRFAHLSAASSLLLMVGSYFIASTFPELFFLLKTLRKVPADAPSEEHLVKDGVKFTAIDLLSRFSTYSDTILIFSFLNPAAVAIYSFAKVIPETLKGSFKTIGVALAAPKLATKTREEIGGKEIIKKYLKVSLALALPVGAYILIAPFVYKLFFPRYLESIVYSQILALGLIALPDQILSESLRATRQMKLVLLNNIFSYGGQIILYVALIALFGLIGAALARVIGRFLSYGVSIVLLRFSHEQFVKNKI